MLVTSEIWVETTVWIKDFDPERHRRLLLEFVKPIIQDLENKNLVETFHTLFEPGLRFLLRIKPKAEDRVAEVRSTVKKYLPNIQDFLVQKTERDLFTEYRGEAEDFGEDGWTITKKVFEMGGRMAIANFDPNFKKGRKFHDEKLLHCFLNSIGHSIFIRHIRGKPVTSEALFHLNQFIGRILIIRGKRSIDSATAAEIKDLIENQIEELKGTIIEVA